MSCVMPNLITNFFWPSAIILYQIRKFLSQANTNTSQVSHSIFLFIFFLFIFFFNVLSYTIDLNGNLTIVGAINNLSLVFPDYPPLTQPRDVDESQFCDDLHWPEQCKGNRLCPCVHRLQVRRNSVVELIIVDESKSKWL